MPGQPRIPSSRSLQDQELERFSRHLLLPEIGLAGQAALLDASVLIVGAGGLAAPVLMYLAAAGVGCLTVVDDDAVELSNLQRQVIHRDADVGVAKVDSAARAVTALNPQVQIRAVHERLSSINALELFAGHDIIVDATDNFATRYVVNDACVLLRLPLVWGSIHRFDGQVTVWSAGEGPCYRCVFPTAPPAGAVPSCAEAGVLGAIPGVIGSIQATEVVKLLLGVGDPLIGRMTIHDALAGSWSTLPLAADPDCAVCGANPSITTLRDEPESCAAPVTTTTAVDLHDRLSRGEDVRVIDVRTNAERDIVALPFAEHVPMEALDSIGDDGRALVLHCKSGVRSAEAVRALSGRGIAAASLEGGILAWVHDVDQSLATY